MINKHKYKIKSFKKSLKQKYTRSYTRSKNIPALERAGQNLVNKLKEPCRTTHGHSSPTFVSKKLLCQKSKRSYIFYFNLI